VDSDLGDINPSLSTEEGYLCIPGRFRPRGIPGNQGLGYWNSLVRRVHIAKPPPTQVPCEGTPREGHRSNIRRETLTKKMGRKDNAQGAKPRVSEVESVRELRKFFGWWEAVPKA